MKTKMYEVSHVMEEICSIEQDELRTSILSVSYQTVNITKIHLQTLRISLHAVRSTPIDHFQSNFVMLRKTAGTRNDYSSKTHWMRAATLMDLIAAATDLMTVYSDLGNGERDLQHLSS